MKYQKEYDEFLNSIGDEDAQILIDKIELFLNKNKMDNKVKSKFIALIGLVINVIGISLVDDYGYSYFKYALELDEHNYFVMNMICSLFDTYPYPLNTLITEREYLDVLEKLAMNFYDMDEMCQKNFLGTVKIYIKLRKKLIK